MFMWREKGEIEQNVPEKGHTRRATDPCVFMPH